MKKTNRGHLIANIVLVGIALIILALFLYLRNTSEPKHKYQWWLEDINWSYRYTQLHTDKPLVKIAVIDTGIDDTHPDLCGAIVDEFSINSTPKDESIDFEHGTSVAGVIVGKPASQDGIQGIAPNSLIYSIDVSNGKDEIDVSDLARAVEKATELNVNIINISMGTTQDDPRLREAIEKAYQGGIVIVASIGNDAAKRTLYPAMYDEVLAVGSLNKEHNELYGQPFDEEIIYLPGENILTTYSSPTSEKKTISRTGTSLSAPILTGIIALIMQKEPLVTTEEIYNYFLQNDNNAWNLEEILNDF